MSMSSMSTHVTPSRRKGFMSQVSSVLLPRKNKQKKEKHESLSESSIINRSASFVEEKTNPSILSSHHEKAHIGENSGYSTINDIHKALEASDVVDIMPQPVPLMKEDLYAVVNKKLKKNRRKAAANAESQLDAEQSCSNSHVKHPVMQPKKETESESKYKYPFLEEEKFPDNEDILNRLRMKNKKTRSSIQQLQKGHHHHHHQQQKQQHDIGGNTSSYKAKSKEVTLERSYREKILELKEKHHAELLNLQQEMENTDYENDILRAKICELLENEAKWKEELDHTNKHQQNHLNAVEKNAELHRRIAKLEMDTKQEVQLLCQQIKSMKHEENKLQEKMCSLQRENYTLQKKIDQLKSEKEGMISVQRHIQSLEVNKTFMEEMKKKYEENADKLEKVFSEIEDERNTMSIQLLLMNDEVKNLQSENTNLKEKQSEITKRKDILDFEIVKIKEKNDEERNIVFGLVKKNEELAAERDSFKYMCTIHENRHEQVKKVFEEHTAVDKKAEQFILDLIKQVDNQTRTAQLNNTSKDLDYNHMKESYERQVHFLQKKLVNQNNALHSLGQEKKKLQIDFQNLWEARLTSETELPNIAQLLAEKNNI